MSASLPPERRRRGCERTPLLQNGLTPVSELRTILRILNKLAVDAAARRRPACWARSSIWKPTCARSLVTSAAPPPIAAVPSQKKRARLPRARLPEFAQLGALDGVEEQPVLQKTRARHGRGTRAKRMASQDPGGCRQPRAIERIALIRTSSPRRSCKISELRTILRVLNKWPSTRPRDSIWKTYPREEYRRSAADDAARAAARARLRQPIRRRRGAACARSDTARKSRGRWRRSGGRPRGRALRRRRRRAVRGFEQGAERQSILCTEGACYVTRWPACHRVRGKRGASVHQIPHGRAIKVEVLFRGVRPNHQQVDSSIAVGSRRRPWQHHTLARLGTSPARISRQKPDRPLTLCTR